MSSTAGSALCAAVLCLVAAPYLAGLTRTLPDCDAARWWRGTRVAPARLAATAVAGLALGALGGAAAGWSALLPAFVALALAATPLVVIDCELHRLPDRLVVPAAVAGAALLAVAAVPDGDWHALLRALEAAFAVCTVLLVLRLVSPNSFGLGDVKLGAILGGYLGWFGWVHVGYGIFAGFLLGAMVSIALVAARRATMKTHVPFGPMLIFGAMLVLAFDLVPAGAR